MSKIVYLLRYQHSSQCTFGIFFAEGETYQSLEPPWLNNQRNVSCIPVGEYKCSYMERSSSGKYRNVYHIKDVSGRTGILTHAGNLPEQTQGCILLGKRRGVLANKPAVLNSRSAINDFVDKMGGEDFILKVINYVDS